MESGGTDLPVVPDDQPIINNLVEEQTLKETKTEQQSEGTKLQEPLTKSNKIDTFLLFVLDTSVILRPYTSSKTVIPQIQQTRVVTAQRGLSGASYAVTTGFQSTTQILDAAEFKDPECIVINRIDFSITRASFSSLSDDLIMNNVWPELIYGCIGIISLLAGKYLITITEREKVGNIRGKSIFKIKKSSIVHLPLDLSQLSESQVKVEKEHTGILQTFLENSRFYYSQDFDITVRAQIQSQFTEDELSQPLWKRIIEETINDQKFSYTLISRRSSDRTGARYHTRGADLLGFVANFVETEQIVESADHVISSFVQTRGSIPLIWHQLSKSLKPKPHVRHSVFARETFKAHFTSLLNKYGKQVIVTLIEQGGTESDLGAYYETAMKLLNHPDIRYVAFDFHARCKNNKYENLSQLVEEVKTELTQFGYFLADMKGKPVLTQKGAFRTNCIDCLDRTNVVQSVFAHYMLKTQLTNLGIISSDVKIEEYAKFESSFKNVWADNADYMSNQYTGTGALKTDFTRTGKRSVKGLAYDGITSLRRYVNKAFQDDQRQVFISLEILTKKASFDLFLGKYIVANLDFMQQEQVFYWEVVNIPVDSAEVVDGKDIQSMIELNAKNETITVYYMEYSEKKTYPFSYLRRMEKSYSDHKLLKLHFATSPVPDYFIFQSRQAMLEFVNKVNSHVFKVAPSSEISSIEKVGIFVGSWDMTKIATVPTVDSVSSWIKKGSQIYVIGIQNCSYPVPNDFVLRNASKHFMFIVEKYLGDDYIVVSVVSVKQELTGGETNTFVFVHKEFCPEVTSIESSKAVYRPLEVAKQSTAQKLKGRILDSINKESKQKEKDPNIIGGGNSLIFSDLMESAIMFRVYDTPFCFVNTIHDKLHNLNSVILLKDEIHDIATHFNHLFWFGIINKECTNLAKWVQLYSTEESGSILWRHLPNVDPMSEIVVGEDIAATGKYHTDFLDSLQAKDGFTPKNPLRFSCKIAIPRSPKLESKKWKINITNLNIETASQQIHKRDTYLIIHAHFLDNFVKTATIKKSHAPSYSDKIEVFPLFSSLEYLISSYIYINLCYQESGNDYLLCRAVMPLRNVIDQAEKMVELHAVLTSKDENVGEIHGKIGFFPLK